MCHHNQLQSQPFSLFYLSLSPPPLPTSLCVSDNGVFTKKTVLSLTPCVTSCLKPFICWNLPGWVILLASKTLIIFQCYATFKKMHFPFNTLPWFDLLLWQTSLRIVCRSCPRFLVSLQNFPVWLSLHHTVKTIHLCLPTKRTVSVFSWPLNSIWHHCFFSLYWHMPLSWNP